jgi:hypothetical protein
MNCRVRAAAKLVSCLIFFSLVGCSTGPGVRDVRELGATGVGASSDTSIFQNALDHCAVHGGEVDVPRGKYMIGSIVVGPNTTLRLEEGAVVWGSADADDYPVVTVRYEGRWVPGHRGLIYADHADHVRILGPGKIVGCRTLGYLRDPRGPVLVEMVGCRDVVLDGFSTSYERMWSIHPVLCDDFSAVNLTIRSVSRANGDGIDVDSCRNVRIENCDIDTGDDAISLKSGRGLEATRTGGPTENVLITRCKLGSKLFAAVGIGTEMSGGIRNVLIEHCLITSGANAFYIKSRTGRGGFMRDIWANDIESYARTFLRIDLLSKGIVDSETVPGEAGIPDVGDIGICDARVECQTLVEASNVSADKPLVGFSLLDISGSCRKGIFLSNVREALVRDIRMKGFSGALISIHNVVGIGLGNAVGYSPSTIPSTRRSRIEN